MHEQGGAPPDEQLSVQSRFHLRSGAYCREAHYRGRRQHPQGKGRIRARTRRDLLTWRHAPFKAALQGKAELMEGLTMELNDEAYTTKTCGFCGRRQQMGGESCTRCMTPTAVSRRRSASSASTWMAAATALEEETVEEVRAAAASRAQRELEEVEEEMAEWRIDHENEDRDVFQLDSEARSEVASDQEFEPFSDPESGSNTVVSPIRTHRSDATVSTAEAACAFRSPVHDEGGYFHCK
ncbi:uncharacterized protein EV422DRAFT_533983 [Fimicolochytrium jonesii]|uniref:uncharacterized protein n=1 Tax=Fimicolochytrium jonesii TaxID=1396493 RepID=UPI0022FDEABD|nr:uncharacterized protein EV422DRAFT_533983 [Fimicolochytrium jonesii]KAI8819699.1 hypothetical protein EV422DRAFT_533983 [Fimicolochytrium jonesii]